MTRARWLTLYGVGTHHVPLTRRAARALLDLTLAVALIICAALAIAGAALHGVAWYIRWTAADVMLDPPALATPARSALAAVPAASCAPPTEFETLLIGITIDDGGNIAADRRYVSPRGGLHRSRSGMPEPRP